jgi:hypothetical protein
MPEVKEKFIYCPSIFSAQGSGFTQRCAAGTPEKVRNGLHIRCFHNPALGLPQTDRTNYIEVIQLSRGRAISNQPDLSSFIDGSIYPVKRYGVGSSASMERMRLVSSARGKSVFVFEKKADYLFNAPNSLDLVYSLTDPDKNEYTRRVFDPVVFEPRLDYSEWMVAPACAVDVAVKPFTPQPLNRLLRGTHKRVIVRGYDWKGRLIAEDWIGERLRLASVVSPARVEVKTRASLRASCISRVEITGAIKEVSPVKIPPVRTRGTTPPQILTASLPGTESLEISSILWVFADDYLQQRMVPISGSQGTTEGFWRKAGEPVGHPLIKMTSDYAFKPFIPDSLPPYEEFASQLAPGTPIGQAIQSLYDAPTAYDMWRIINKESRGNSTSAQRVLSMLSIAMIEPLIARFMGTYYFSDNVHPELEWGDYKVIWHNVPFFRNENLARIEVSGSWLNGRQLAGLVMNAEILKDKPLPEIPRPLSLKIKPTALNSGTLLVNADICITDSAERVTLPTDGIVYRAARTVRADIDPVATTSPLVEPAGGGGILPPCVLPEVNKENPLLSTVIDVFSAMCKEYVSVFYRLQPFDMFGRRGKDVVTDKEKALAPEYPPASCANPASFARCDADTIALCLKFQDPVDPEDDPFVIRAGAVELAVFSRAAGGTVAAPVAGSFHGEIYELDLMTNRCSVGNAVFKWQSLPSGNVLITESVTLIPAPAEPVTVSVETVTLRNDDEDEEFAAHALQRVVALASVLGAGEHQWNVRFRSKGISRSGAPLFSTPLWAPARLTIRTQPPVLTQPELGPIPVSTRPDRYGDSFYTVDLASLVSAGLSVDIYMASLDNLNPSLAALSDNDILTAVPGLALTGRLRFNRQNQAPITLSDATRFHPIKVRGNLQNVFVVYVVGVSSDGDEADWDNGVVLAFRTPRLEFPPQLKLLRCIQPEDSAAKLALSYTAGFDAPAPNGLLPSILLYRTDKTAGTAKKFVMQVPAATSAVENGMTVYKFPYEDTDVSAWRKYEYEARLVYFDEAVQQNIRSAGAVRLSAKVNGLPAQSPVIRCNVSGDAMGIEVALPTGEFDIRYMLYRGPTVLAAVRASVSGGTVLNVEDATLFSVTVLGTEQYKVTYRHTEPIAEDMRCVVTVTSGPYHWSVPASSG